MWPSSSPRSTTFISPSGRWWAGGCSTARSRGDRRPTTSRRARAGSRTAPCHSSPKIARSPSVLANDWPTSTSSWRWGCSSTGTRSRAWTGTSARTGSARTMAMTASRVPGVFSGTFARGTPYLPSRRRRSNAPGPRRRSCTSPTTGCANQALAPARASSTRRPLRPSSASSTTARRWSPSSRARASRPSSGTTWSRSARARRRPSSASSMAATRWCSPTISCTSSRRRAPPTRSKRARWRARMAGWRSTNTRSSMPGSRTFSRWATTRACRRRARARPSASRPPSWSTT